MSASSIRSHLERKRQQRVDAEKRVAGYRRTESQKRAAAAKAHAAARGARSASTANSKQREGDRLEREANTASAQVATWSTKAAGYAKEESALLARLASAEQAEARSAEQKRKRDADAAERRRKQEMAEVERRHRQAQSGIEGRLSAAETDIQNLRQPKVEKLRVLVLLASADGDLRVAREVKRIAAGIRAATNRDLIELDVRMAATPADLLDGLVQSRPHVVHFSGHAAESVVVFEEDVDIEPNDAVVREADLARALSAVKEPPLLVVLNACDTARQAEHLANAVALVAVGMSASVADGDAITFAARFYTALVDGQPIASAFELARVELAFNGAADPDLPLLFEREPGLAEELILVLTPEE